MASNNDDEKDRESSLQKSNQMVVWLNVITIVVCAAMCGYLYLNYQQDRFSTSTKGTSHLENILNRLDILEKNMKKNVNTTDTKITDNDKTPDLEDIHNRLDRIEKNMKTNVNTSEAKNIVTDKTPDLKDIPNRLDRIEENIDEKIKDLKKTIAKLENQTLPEINRLNVSVIRIENGITSITSQCNVILASIGTIEQEVNNLTRYAKTLNHTTYVKIMLTKRLLQNEIHRNKLMIHQTRKIGINLRESVDKIDSTIDDNLLPNKDTVKQTTVSLLVIIGVIVILVMGLSNQINKIRGTSNEQPLPVAIARTTKHDSQPPNPILKQLPANQTLETAICLLSFYEDSKEEHEALFRSIGLPERVLHHVSVKNHIIHRHEDIPQIPPSKLYFTFTNFTERHVIIEERGLGLGDLKRTTLDAIYKLKGSLVMIYVRDPGSRSIPDNTRFNRDIYCVTSQPELVLVNKMGRFFSVFDKLTDFQRKCLQNIIYDEFKL